MNKKDIAAMSVNDLKERLKEEQGLMTKLTLSHAVSPIDSPAKIRTTRRTIARLITELKKKESSKN